MAKHWAPEGLGPNVAEAWTAFTTRYAEMEAADTDDEERSVIAEERFSAAQEKLINAAPQTPADLAAKLRAIVGDFAESHEAGQRAISGSGIPRIVLDDYRYLCLWKIIEQAEKMAS